MQIRSAGLLRGCCAFIFQEQSVLCLTYVNEFRNPPQSFVSLLIFSIGLKEEAGCVILLTFDISSTEGIVIIFTVFNKSRGTVNVFFSQLLKSLSVTGKP